MRWLMEQIRRVPTWIWLFVALTQVGSTLANVDRLNLCSDHPELQAVFAEIRTEARIEVAVSSVLASTAMALAIWKWRRGGE